MVINVRIISELDPGAIPGGSTIIHPLARFWRGIYGADQHRQACKGVAFTRYGSPRSAHFIVANDNFAPEYALAA
jgi:hypothetical protein